MRGTIGARHGHGVRKNSETRTGPIRARTLSESFRAKQIWDPFFSTQKNMFFQMLFVQMLKNEPNYYNGKQKRGSHLFKRSGTFLQKLTKRYPPWDPQRLPKTEKVQKKNFPKTKWKKRMKKDPNEKDIDQGYRRFPKVTPPSPPYPGRATLAHPQSRVSAKALESLLKPFALVCSIHFVVVRRIDGF